MTQRCKQSENSAVFDGTKRVGFDIVRNLWPYILFFAALWEEIYHMKLLSVSDSEIIGNITVSVSDVTTDDIYMALENVGFVLVVFFGFIAIAAPKAMRETLLMQGDTIEKYDGLGLSGESGFFADKKLDFISAIMSKKHIEGIYSYGGNYFMNPNSNGGDTAAVVKAHRLLNVVGPDIMLNVLPSNGGAIYTPSRIYGEVTIKLGEVSPFSLIK